MLLFHLCKKFEEKIASQSYEKPVRKKIEELSMMTDKKSLAQIKNIEFFGAKMAVYKTMKPHSRTIFQEEIIEVDGKDITVFFIRDFLEGSKDFNHTWYKTTKQALNSGAWAKDNPIEEEEKVRFRNQYRLKYSSELAWKDKKSTPPTSITEWLNDFSLKLNFDVYESEEWMRYALNPNEQDGMRGRDVMSFRILLKAIIENDGIVMKNAKLLNSHSDFVHTYWVELHEVGIVYTEIQHQGKRLIYLYDGVHLKTQATHLQEVLALKHLPVWEGDILESITRNATKAYPSWTVNDDDLWYSIQKNTENSNLSLLPEQLGFLKTFRFPSYINGQAGSGKSTMLAYLFANAYYLKCLGYIQGKLIFLTENEALLQKSKESIHNLLGNNPEFAIDGTDHLLAIDECFASFKNFLLAA
jgi:hypothetical protein